MLEAVKNPPKEAKHATTVERRRGEAAQHNAQIMAIGGLHGAGRVAGGDHGSLNESGKAVKIRGNGGEGRNFCE